MYGHIAKIAEAEKAGIEAAGGKADVYRTHVSEFHPSSLSLKMESHLTSNKQC